MTAILLEKGAQFDVRDHDDLTPFMLALKFGVRSSVLQLLELRAAEFPPAEVLAR